MEKSIISGLTNDQIEYLNKIKCVFETENYLREEENKKNKLSSSERFYKVTCITDGGKYFGRDIGFIAKVYVSSSEFDLECVFMEEDYLFEAFSEDILDKISEGNLYEDYDAIRWGDDYDYADSIRENGAYLIIEQKEISEEEYNNSSSWVKPSREEIKLMGD
jgi:predicted  nucleic acid-binding Zn ribbon protein